MPEDNRVAEVLEDWYERREQGLDCDPKAVVEAHPELAEVLVRHFAALEVFDRMAGARGAAGTPQALGEFRILRELGRGGMGVVYEAEQASMRRSVALKVLYPGVTSSLRAVRRFQREAQAAGRLHHTHIVPVYGMGEDRGVWYYAMELVAGRPLQLVLEDRRRLRGREAGGSGLGEEPGTRKYYEHLAGMFAGVAEGLQTAHEAGVVHRDVKPSNLLLDEGGTLRLTDFGLARVDGDGPTMTLSGDLVGTPAYMSPEQAGADGEKVDARTDVYSLGATLYEALTLRPPHRGKSAAEVAAAVLTRDPPAPRRLEPRIPRDLETVVLKAMERNPRRRYATAGDMAADLRHFAEGLPIRARRIGPVGKVWRLARRHPVASSLAAAVMVLAAGGGALALRSSRQAAELRDRDYEALCLRIDEGVAGQLDLDWNLPLSSPGAGRELLGEAIALRPERPEAYFGRALLAGATIGERLADLEAAQARGLDKRACHLAKATMLGLSDRAAEATQEDRLSEQAPASQAPEAAYFEGVVLFRQGEREEALRKFEAALRESPHSGFVRTLARHARARVREMEGDLAGAIDDLSALASGGSDPGVGARIRMAQLWAQLGKDDRAQALLKEVFDELEVRGTGESWSAACSECRRYQKFYASEWKRFTEAALRHFPDDPGVLEERLRALAAMGKHEEALELAQKAVGLQPRNGSLLVQYGWCLWNLKQGDKALDVFRRAQEMDKRSTDAIDAMAEVLHGLGRDDEALAAVERAALLNPGTHKYYHMRAISLAELGRREDALAAVDRAVRLDPRCEGARTLKVGLLIELGKATDALEEARAVCARSPGSSPAHGLRGRALLACGKHAEAREAYERAIALDSRSAAAHNGLAGALRAAGDLEGALGEYRRAVALDEGSPLFRRNLGDLLIEMGRYTEARGVLEQAVALDPGGSGDSKCLLAGVLNNLGFPEKALPLLDEVLKHQDRDATAHAYRAHALRNLKHPEDAKKAVERALEIDPEHSQANFEKGQLAWDEGRRDDALACFERVLKRDPGNFACLNEKGIVLIDLNRLPEALVTFTELCRRRPDLKEAKLNLGNVYRGMKKLEDALKAYDEAAHLDPNWGFAHCNRGLALAELDRPAEALQAYGKAAAINPRWDEPVLGRARMLKRLGKGPEALEAYAQAEGLRGQKGLDLEDELDRIEFQDDAEKFDEALAGCDRALGRFPRASVLYRVKGGILGRMDRDADAAAVLEKAIGSFPEDTLLPYRLGVHLRGAGRLEDAVRALQEYLRIAPAGEKRFSAEHQIAICLRELGRSTEALAAIDQAATAFPDATEALSFKAVVLAGLGRFPDAEKTLSEALTRAPDNNDVLEDLTVARLAMGQFGKGLESAERLVKQEGDPFTAALKVRCLRALGKGDEAKATAQEFAQKEPKQWGRLGCAYLCAVLGDRLRATELLAGYKKTWQPLDMVERARVHAVLGEQEEALHWLEAAVEKGWRRPAAAPADPDFRGLEVDPRFAKLLARMQGE